MTNGAPTPDQHDGMGAILTQGRGEALEVTIVRNHERARGSPIVSPALYDASVGQERHPAGRGHDDAPVPRQAVGERRASLGGTIYNCAGGATPWGTWLSCEETVIDLTSRGGRRHGYVFEVRAQAAETTAKPIVDMGRMKHEAVSIDPATKIAYLTEDNPGNSCFYRFIPHDASGLPGSYEAGGRLQAPRVVGRANVDLRRPVLSEVHPIEWVDIEHPDADPGSVQSRSHARRRHGQRSIPAGDRGWRRQDGQGGGCVPSRRKVLHRRLRGGRKPRRSRAGHGDGAIWELDPAEGTLRAIFVSGRQLVADNIDNITVSPRGAILLCEDGDPVTDRYGPGTRLIALTGEGDSYAFAKNNIHLSRKLLVTAGEARLAEGLPRRGMGGRLLRRERRGALRQHPDAGHHVRHLGPLGTRQPLTPLKGALIIFRRGQSPCGGPQRSTVPGFASGGSLKRAVITLDLHA